MSTPVISVVMSVFNDAQYLRQSVDSILSQEGVDFEFIIVNDGSTDESGAMLTGYTRQDKRVRIIEQENAGLTLALIRGCREARGEYIARQDADDFSMPGRLRALYELAEANREGVLFSSWVKQIGPDGEELNTIRRQRGPQQATDGLLYQRQGPPAHGSVMFRKGIYEKVGGYREQFYYGQDADLWLRIARLGFIVYVSEVFYCYRIWDGITVFSRDIQKQFGELGQACHKARLHGESEDGFLAAAASLREQVLAGKYSSGYQRRRNIAAGYYLIASSLEKNRDKGALGYFLRAAAAHPLYWRAWVRMLMNLAVRR